MGTKKEDDRDRRHREVMERAAALRARQTRVADAAALVREGREALERRGHMLERRGR